MARCSQNKTKFCLSVRDFWFKLIHEIQYKMSKVPTVHDDYRFRKAEKAIFDVEISNQVIKTKLIGLSDTQTHMCRASFFKYSIKDF